ncbi:unnamed protein product [Rotaria sordida]|uniref:F-box domain-containing protein n=1 Tax=Rotaria sordida TaxID=392033 RepID=A0A815V5Z7_9BILA|nr:unnamed protein product [Rotaria sordida]CAF1526317.1 unnamed protein product [Rotaria sordida]
MNQSNVSLLDLPNEILITILKKLDNMDVLYSIMNIGNQRLDNLVLEKTFTKTLNFVLTTLNDDIVSIDDSIFNQLCINILPRIDYNVKSLILESVSMERILLAADYPNLTELKIFNFNEPIFAYYFAVESPIQRFFQQITDLIIVYKDDKNTLLMKQYPKGVHGCILKFFENLKHLSITGLNSILSLRNLPLTTCSSSILYKLCINLNTFEDCLALLDGRLKQLTTVIININSTDYHSPNVYNMDDLLNMKCFSLKCRCRKNEYDTKILPLLRRMPNLEELTLNIINSKRITFVDGTQINNEILIHMPRLYKFIFNINTRTKPNDLVHYLSNDDIQRTFTNIGYEQVCCIVNYVNIGIGICHVFSLPFMFDYLEYIGNKFPPIDFSHVVSLGVYDSVPFEHEFFIRIGRFFPFLKELRVINFESQSHISSELNFHDNQLHSIVEYSHLISLILMTVHIDYVEQFLNDRKTHLPRLTTLTVDYDQLTIVTENFTRDITRLNCTKIKELTIEESREHSKDFYVYFPLLESCLCSDSD